MKRIVIAGATGQVGRNLVADLAVRADCRVVALVRKTGSLTAQAPELSELSFDFEDPAAYARLGQEDGLPCDVLFIALGTTRAKAGAAAFWHVDRDYPVQLIQALAKSNPGARVGLVSSVGADQPTGLYLRAKAEVESALGASGLAHAIARPSFLLSRRKEFRFGEVVVARFLAPPWLWLGRHLFPRSPWFWKLAPVKVEEVAASLLGATLELPPGAARILEGLDLRDAP